jgi:hypothetical protein
MSSIRRRSLMCLLGVLVAGGTFASAARAQTSDRDAASVAAEDLRAELEGAKSALRSSNPMSQEVEALIEKLDQLSVELDAGKRPVELRKIYREIQASKQRLIQYGRVSKGPAPVSKAQIEEIQALLKELDLYFEKVR